MFEPKTNFWIAVQAAEEAGVILEMVGGVPTWEAFPNIHHQTAIDRIRATIRRTAAVSEGGCACLHWADMYIRFPEGSIKRPDIAIYCSDPATEEDVVTEVPRAVVEVLSKGYESKDLLIGVPFYLEQGVDDVLVFDHRKRHIYHFTKADRIELDAPQTINLVCGCTVSF